MAWRLIRQPNGKLARFSEVVDDFTHTDMTEREAVTEFGPIAVAKILRADTQPHRYHEALSIINEVHGDST